jgi:hypothetical protein
MRSIRQAAVFGGAALVLTAGLSVSGCSDDDEGDDDLDATVTEVSTEVSEGVTDASEAVDDAVTDVSEELDDLGDDDQ